VSILDNLSQKKILLSTIKEKLEGTGIKKIVIVFMLETDNYNVMLTTGDGKSMKVDITADEITTLKKLFIRRIVSKWNEKYDEEPKDVIIQVNLMNEETELDVFIQTKDDKVLKFDYK
jgi:hypothetical protein